MLDSVPVSQLSNPAITVGKYVDDQLGTVTANSFFRVTRPESFTGTYSINPTAVFDKLQLLLIYNKDSVGDVTKPFTINVHRLTAPLKPNTDGYFYNHHDVPCDPELFGTATFLPRPYSDDTIFINLDNNFGNELFNLMKSKDQKISNNDYFQQYFKGLKLAYDNTNQAVIGFTFPLGPGSTPYPAMRLYYHYTDATIIKKFFDFQQYHDIPLPVEPLPPTALARLQCGKLALPVAEDVRRNPSDGRDLSDPEIETIRNIRGSIARGERLPLARYGRGGRNLVLAPRRPGHGSLR